MMKGVVLALAASAGVVAHGGAVAPAGRQQAATTQTPQDPQRTFRSGADAVVVPATVTDVGGRFVRDLTRDDFEIRDNGKVQDITIFDRQYETVSVVVMLDASASMLPLLDRVIAAANDFVVRLMPGDQARVGSFAEEIRISPDFIGDRDALLAIFANEFNVRIGRRTRLWDAMHDAIERLARAGGRRVVIVMTDGVDSWSTKTFDDVMSAARRRNVSVFAVMIRHRDRGSQTIEFSGGPDGSGPGRRSLQPRDAFETLTRDTGGGHVDVDAQWADQAPFTDIMLDLHSAYVLGFAPSILDDKVHDITVNVRRTGLKVKARRTYVASRNASADGGGGR
jgi:Ca-activated chloride channel family protein